MFKKKSALYLRLLSYVKIFWPMIITGIISTICYSAIDAGFTYMMRPFLDKGLINIDINFINKIPIIVLIGITIRGVAGSIGTYCMTWVSSSLIKILRQQIFSHAIKLPSSYYDQSTSGQLLSKILYDVEQVAKIGSNILTDFIQNICLIIGLLVVMLIVSWKLSLMFLFIVPIISIIVNYTNKRIRKISHIVQQSIREVTDIIEELIEGYKIIRIFGKEKYEIKKFFRATEMSRKNDMKVAFNKAINVSVVQFIIALGIALIVLTAIQLTTFINITAGSFLAIIAAMLQIIKPMKTLTVLNATIQKGLAGAESVFSLLDLAIESDNGTYFIKRAKGIIEFKKVYFSYRNKQLVLENINFKLSEGETVAIVGHSGSGKTTIISLLTRFYEPNSGKITLDGYSISDISLNSLRKQISLVSQNIMLFNDTLINNIAYGNYNKNINDIIYAAKLSLADEFIQLLPNGYYTKVGENGILLSGGQRQRLAIARAILKDAPILIFDEATSSLDIESERKIQIALENIINVRTTLIIAHRLSTIKKANKIIVLNKGKIVEQGSHSMLLSLDGYYSRLYRTQEYNIKL